MGTILSAISMAMSIFCYSYCGTKNANISPLEKPETNNERTQNEQ